MSNMWNFITSYVIIEFRTSNIERVIRDVVKSGVRLYDIQWLRLGKEYYKLSGENPFSKFEMMHTKAASVGEKTPH